MEHVSSSGTSKPSAEELLAERGWLLGLARSLVGGSQAEDLVQEAYVVALERSPQAGYSGRAWLAGIARNLARGLRRKDAARARREQMRTLGAEQEAGSDVALLAERAELETRAVQELLALREPLRETLLLHFQGGLRPAEIARRQRVPAATVRGRLKVGLDELRSRMDAATGGRSAWAVVLAGDPARGGGGSVSVGSTWMLGAMMKKGILGLGVVLIGWLGLWQSGVLGPGSEGGTAPGGVELGVAQSEGADELLVGELMLPLEATVGRAGAGEVGLWLRARDGEGRAVELSGGALLLGGGARELEALGDGRVGTRSVPDEAALRAVLSRPGAWPCVLEVPGTPGTHEVLWPVGVRVEGHLTGRGASLPENFALGLERDTGWAGWVTEEQAREVDGSLERQVGVAPDGHFSLTWLPLDWRGWLKLPAGWEFARGGSRSELFQAAGASELAFEVQRVPRLVGRLIDAGSGAGLGGRRIDVSEGLGWAGPAETRSAPDGTFELAVESSALPLKLAFGGEFPWQRQELELLELIEGGVHDLGDLALERSLEVRFRVVDEDGRGLAGARVRESAYGIENEARADAAGEGSLGVALERPFGVVVLAPGHRVLMTSLDPSLDEVQVLRLEAGLHVRVRVVDGQGTPIESRAVHLILRPGEGEDPLAWHLRDFELLKGSLMMMFEDEDGARALVLQCDAQGELELAGLDPAVRSELGLRDSQQQWIDPPLVLEADAFGEWTGELVDRDSLRFPLHGRVVTSSGSPVEDAELRFAPLGNVVAPTATTSDAEGRFRLWIPEAGSEGLLHAEARGFASSVMGLDAAKGDRQELRVVLAEERPLVVTVVRPDGSEVPRFGVAMATRLPGGGAVRGERIEREGSEPFAMEGLGAGQIEVLLWEQRLRHEFTIAAGKSEARLEIPAPAFLEFDLAGLGDPPPSSMQYYVLERDSQGLVTNGVLRPEGAAGERPQIAIPGGSFELWLNVAETVLELPIEAQAGERVVIAPKLETDPD